MKSRAESRTKIAVPDGLRADGSAHSVPLAWALADDYLAELVRRRKVTSLPYRYGHPMDGPQVEAVVGDVHGIADTFALACMNAFCCIMHPPAVEDGPIVWSMPDRACGMCGNKLGEHPQARRLVERIGPELQTHLTRACNGALLDFGGWAPAKDRAWWRRVDEIMAQGKFRDYELAESRSLAAAKRRRNDLWLALAPVIVCVVWMLVFIVALLFL